MGKGRAQILEIDIATGEGRSFATGLRNPAGMAFEPQSGALWVVVNERDELARSRPRLSPREGGRILRLAVQLWGHISIPGRAAEPRACGEGDPPDYALGNHVAPLGLAFVQGDRLPDQFRNGASLGARLMEPRSLQRIQVVFVPFSDGQPAGQPVDVLTGFLAIGARPRDGRSESP
jgi:glucose/arabinose dehydrogenase